MNDADCGGTLWHPQCITHTHTHTQEGRKEGKHSQVGSWLVVGWLVGKTDRGEVGKIWKFVWLNSTEDIFQIGDRRF